MQSERPKSMVALADLILAETPEQYEQLQHQFRAEQAAMPSDAEVLTAFMRDGTDLAGNPLLQADEYADLVAGTVSVKKFS